MEHLITGSEIEPVVCIVVVLISMATVCLQAPGVKQMLAVDTTLTMNVKYLSPVDEHCLCDEHKTFSVSLGFMYGG